MFDESRRGFFKTALLGILAVPALVALSAKPEKPQEIRLSEATDISNTVFQKPVIIYTNSAQRIERCIFHGGFTWPWQTPKAALELHTQRRW